MIEKLNQDLQVLNQYLEDEVQELSAGLHEEQWKVLGLMTHLEQMQAQQEIMMGRLDAMNVALVVIDLTQEENEGGLGGPIFLAPETPTVSLDSEEERARGRQELLIELDGILASFVHVEEEKMTEGEYTPTRPSAWGPEF